MKARKKPIEVEYFIYDGDYEKLRLELGKEKPNLPDWILKAFCTKTLFFTKRYRAEQPNDPYLLYIILRGGKNVLISTGDYILREVTGNMYSCEPDVFLDSYDLIDEVEYTVTDAEPEVVVKEDYDE